jgi:hypothetical protein
MKKSMLVCLMVISLFLSCAAFAELTPVTIGGQKYVPAGQVEETGQYGYIELARLTANDTPLAATGKSWAGVLSSDRWVRVPRQFTNFVNINVYAHGKDINDPSAGAIDVNCHVMRPYGGAQTVFKATYAIGDVRLSNDPNSGAILRADGAATADPNSKWANAVTINVGSDDYEWPTGVLKSGYLGTELYDNIAGVWFKPLGVMFIRVEGTNATWTNIDRYVIVMTGG